MAPWLYRGDVLDRLLPVATGDGMVYVAVIGALSAKPLATAMASSVVVDESVIGPLYAVEEGVGFTPFVV